MSEKWIHTNMNIQSFRIRISFVLMLPLFITSCEKEVVLDLADKSGAYLIVEANIGNDGTAQEVLLSWSGSYYQTGRLDPVNGAVVSISGQSGNFVFEALDAGKPGVYVNREISMALNPGDYLLRIDIDDKRYLASSRMEPVPAIDSLSVRINPFWRFGPVRDTVFDAVVHFRTSESRQGYYLFDFYVNGESRTSLPSQKRLIDEANLNSYVGLGVFSFSMRDVSRGDTLRVQMRSISREQYQFYRIFFIQTDLSGNPFAGAPPANIPTNMSEGARGFFQVSSVVSSQMIF